MSNTIIKPSIGRVVWFYATIALFEASKSDPAAQPHAALVTYVHNDRLVNLAVFDGNGESYNRTSVQLVQEGDQESGGMHARWMPYQLGQAAKTEKAESAVKAIPAATDSAIEQEIQAKGLTAPRITPDAIEANIASETYFTAAEGTLGALVVKNHLEDATTTIDDSFDPSVKLPLDLLTFCVLTLKNGFTVTGESACASPENFNAEIGRKIARQNAVQKIWPLMGYELRSQIARRPNPANGAPKPANHNPVA